MFGIVFLHQKTDQWPARVLGLQKIEVSLLLIETPIRHKIAFYERQLRNERGMTARAERY